MKLSPTFLKSIEDAADAGSFKENYLRYTKLKGDPANFALLELDPLCYWLVWGESSNGLTKPFRFHKHPSKEDIGIVLGAEYTQCLNFDKTGIRPPVECLTWPVYNWDLKHVQVLEVSHVSLARQFAKYGLNRKYSKNLLSWDFELTKVMGDMTRYELLIVPRDDDEHDEEAMESAWNSVNERGFDLERIIYGDDPFNTSL